MVILNTMESKTALQQWKYPKAVGFIISNEFCERFSYYGMRTILSLYLRHKLGFDDNGATVIYHMFSMFAYFFPVLGAMLADGWLGKYKTILYLSLVYATGSILISITAIPPLHFPQIAFTIIALMLIAFGTGGIKPCVSAFGGDQFKLPEQVKFLGYFFSLFYFAINAGSLISTFLTPILRADVQCFGEDDCYSLAFGLPGILMVVSIIMFVSGKRFYKVKEPSGNIIGKVAQCIYYAVVKSFKSKEKRQHWLDRADDKYDPNLIEDIKSLLRVLVLFIPLPVFWALFDQQGSRWTFQADRMRQDIGNWTLKADQMQVINPLLILVFIPLFQVVIYPFMYRYKLIKKPLHKMIWGGVLAACAFIISGIVELHLLPTYGTQVSSGLAQLRVYNGYDCEMVLKGVHFNNNQGIKIQPLSVYENLNIEAKDYVDLPYSIQGGAACSSVKYDGSFHLMEKTANSFFINNNGVSSFTDDNSKAIDSANVRFLANVRSNVDIELRGANTNKAKYSEPSSSKGQKSIVEGKYDVAIDSQVVVKDFYFKHGAVYTINVFEEDKGGFMASVVMITPPNSIHILWLIPQYVVMTMGEVMFSITGLEFSFTQAPASMKSVLQSVWLMTVAFGNLVVILIVEGNFLDAQWKEFFLFAGLMLVDMLIFTAMAFRYKYAVLKSSTENIPEEIVSPEHNAEKKPDVEKKIAEAP